MLKAVIVDDEQPAVVLLQQMLGQRTDVEVIGAFTKTSELLQSMANLRPDVAFLDIEMPGMNGLELAARLLEINENVEIVFVTAYNQYALEAFRVNAFDYLLKPADPKRLGGTVERMIRRKGIPLTPAVEKVPRIECFGRFEVYAADREEPIHFLTLKSEELLSFFLVNRGMNVSKWTICESLWPGFDPEKAEQNLHTTVFRMKKTLLENGIRIQLKSSRGSYRFDPTDDFACDYLQFNNLRASLPELNDQTAADWEKAIRLYKGPLFAGKDYPWCEVEKERSYREFADVSKRFALWQAEKGDHPRARDTLLFILSRIPFDEEVHTLTLQTYIRLKDRSAFFEHYKRMEDILQQELGVNPTAEMRKLFEQAKQ